jgi:predicted secreted protein
MRRRSFLLLPPALVVLPARGQELRLPPLNLPGLPAAPTVTAPAPAPASDAWPQAAFEAATVDDVRARFGIGQAQASPDILLDAPEIALASEPVEVIVEVRLPAARRVVLVADRLPRPLLSVISWPSPAGLRTDRHVAYGEPRGQAGAGTELVQSLQPKRRRRQAGQPAPVHGAVTGLKLPCEARRVEQGAAAAGGAQPGFQQGELCRRSAKLDRQPFVLLC